MYSSSYYSKLVNSVYDSLNSFLNDDFFSMGLCSSSCPSKTSNAICSSAYPKSDIYKTEDGALHIEAAVSGYSEDEISCSYEDKYITIFLKKEEPKEKRNYLQSGIKYSKEQSKISFYVDPVYFDADKATADLENGIFHITVPANPKLAKSRFLFGKKKENEIEDKTTLNKKQEKDKKIFSKAKIEKEEVKEEK